MKRRTGTKGAGLSGVAAVVGSVPAGLFPREFGRSPGGRTPFVSNYISSELEVIDLKRMPVAVPAKNQ